MIGLLAIGLFVLGEYQYENFFNFNTGNIITVSFMVLLAVIGIINLVNQKIVSLIIEGGCLFIIFSALSVFESIGESLSLQDDNFNVKDMLKLLEAITSKEVIASHIELVLLNIFFYLVVVSLYYMIRISFCHIKSIRFISG